MNPVYDDDTALIPRSTSVVARRLPPSKPGAGRAARYMSGKVPTHAKNASRKEPHGKQALGKTTAAPAPTPMHAGMTEEQKMAAMFEAQGAAWNAQQEELAS